MTLIAYSYSGAGMEYDQAIVLLPIVDYTEQKKNWKRIKDAIVMVHGSANPKKLRENSVHQELCIFSFQAHTQKKNTNFFSALLCC